MAVAKRKSDLDQVAAKEKECDIVIDSSERCKNIFEDCDLARPSAQSSQKEYLSLKGLHSWIPVETGDSRIPVGSIGHGKNTCTTLVSDVSKTREVTTDIVMKTEVPNRMKKSLRKYSGPLSAFLDENVQRLASSLKVHPTTSASNLSQKIQN